MVQDKKTKSKWLTFFRWLLIAGNAYLAFVFFNALASGYRIILEDESTLLFAAVFIINCVMLAIKRDGGGRPSLLALWLEIRRKEMEKRLEGLRLALMVS